MTDHQIIQQILTGNTNAYELLVSKYQHMVFRTAIGFVHSKEDAEDVSQDVFIKTYTSLHLFKGDSEFSTWLYRITINTAINFANKNKIRNLFDNIENVFTVIFNRETNDENALQKIVSEEKTQKIKRAIESLHEKQKTAFVLSKYEELPQKQIAEIMKISEGAVEQLLQRAKSNLQKKLSHLQ